MTNLTECGDEALGDMYLGGDLLVQEADWVDTEWGGPVGTSQWEAGGGVRRSRALAGPQSWAGGGKDQQTWNVSDRSKYSAGSTEKMQKANS